MRPRVSCASTRLVNRIKLSAVSERQFIDLDGKVSFEYCPSIGGGRFNFLTHVLGHSLDVLCNSCIEQFHADVNSWAAVALQTSLFLSDNLSDGID